MSDIQVNLVCCTEVIANEIRQGVRQKDIALTYAMAIKSQAQKADNPDWPAINKAIIDRWDQRGLKAIKNRAWKLLRDAGYTP